MDGSRKVDFVEDLVTGVSRPLDREERGVLHSFESHAQNCRHCHKPREVYLNGDRLCEYGHELAVKVNKLLFKLKDDGKLYACSSRRGVQDVCVEMPHNYTNTISLFKAIALDNGLLQLRKKSKKPSFDRTYEVRPRSMAGVLLDQPLPKQRHYSDPRTSSAGILADPDYDLYSTSFSRPVIEPDTLPVKKRHGSKRQSKHMANQYRESRGSLWESDLLAEEAREREEAGSTYLYSTRYIPPRWPR